MPLPLVVVLVSVLPPPELPGEPLPPGVTARYGSLHYRTPGPVYGSALSPDGRLLALAGPGGVGVYEVPAWRLVRRLAAPSDAFKRASPRPLLFSPDGKYLAYRRTAGAVAVWEVAGVRPVRELAAGTDDRWGPLLAFTADGRLALTGPEVLYFYDPATGAEVRSVAAKNVLAVSPDGAAFIRADRPPPKPNQRPDDNPGEAVLGDARTGADVRRLGRIPPFCDEHRCGVAFAPDGKTYALVGRNGYAADIWETASGEFVRSLIPPAVLYPRFRPGICGPEVGFMLDGSVYVLRQDHDLIRWDPAGRELPALVAGHDPPPGGLHVLPDGTLLTPTGDGWVRVWSPDGTERRVSGRYRGPVRVVPSPDGVTVAVADEAGRIDLRAATTGRMIRTIRERCRWSGPLVLSPDGSRLAVKEFVPGDDGRPDRHPVIRAYRTADGGLIGTVAKLEVDGHRQPDPVGFTPDGRVVIDRLGLRPPGAPNVAVWDPGTGAKVAEYRAGDDRGRRGLSPDGRVLAAEDRGAGVFFDATTGAELWRAAGVPSDDRWSGSDARFGWSADGATVAVPPQRGPLLLLDARTGRERRRFPVVPPADRLPQPRMREWEVDPVRVSSDGRWVAAAAPGFWHDGYVAVWEAASGALVAAFGQTDRAAPGEATFTPDGRSLLLGYHGYAERLDFVGTLARHGAGTPVELWERAGDAADAGRGVGAALGLVATADGRKLVREKLAAPPAGPPAERVRGWVADLGSDDFATREAASKELTAHARRLAPTLREARRAATAAEVQRRLDAVLKAADGKPTPDELRVLRVVQAAELAGTPETRELLAAWAAGLAGAVLTEDAKAALARTTSSG